MRGADEWRRAYFVLADIVVEQQAKVRKRMEALPEVLDANLGYSVVRRTDVLNVLDSPADPVLDNRIRAGIIASSPTEEHVRQCEWPDGECDRER